MSVRIIVQIDEPLMARVHRLVPVGGFNTFVNQALSAQIDAMEREQLERDMIEGYLATREDRDALSCDWGIVDGEGWV